MKTALELLGSDGCTICGPDNFCRHDLDLVAQRAREEMREMAYLAAMDAAVDGVYDQSAKDTADRVAAALIDIPVKP